MSRMLFLMPPNVVHIALRPNRATVAYPALFIGSIVVVSAISAIFSADSTFRVFMGTVSATLLLITAGAITAILRKNTIQFRASTRNLRFVGPATATSLLFAAYFCALAPAAQTLLSGVINIRFDVIGLLGFAAIVQQIIAFRVPRGLTLSHSGLHGIRGSKRLNIAWAELDRADAVTLKNGASLKLTLSSGQTMAIQPQHLGSDPNVVAYIVTFFLNHPEHRATLSNPTAALALVKAQ